MDGVTEEKGRPTVTVGTQTDSREGRGKDIVYDGSRALERRLTVTVDMKSNKRLFKLVERSDQLLPGIPDDITLNHIVPKMEWRVFHILSLVSSGWRQAIQSHRAHDARVRSKLTDTFLVIHDLGLIILYSPRDKYWCHLPGVPVPQLSSWKWTALDGSLYAIGGGYDSREVYVLDLAGQREWKECASMEKGRHDFGCCVKGGRIYVFGGMDGDNPFRGSEVYDPNDNSWSAICPEITFRSGHDTAAFGEELFLFNGQAYYYLDEGARKILPYRAVFWEVYHPVKDEWHIVRPSSPENGWGRVFMSKGKFYMMNDDGLDVLIDVYDYDQKTWSQLHSSSIAGIGGINAKNKWYDMIRYDMIVVVNDELFIAVCNDDSEPDVLLRSNGFGSDKKEILWTIESVPLWVDYNFVCTVEL